jgi:hypothetical protein
MEITDEDRQRAYWECVTEDSPEQLDESEEIRKKNYEDAFRRRMRREIREVIRMGDRPLSEENLEWIMEEF